MTRWSLLLLLAAGLARAATVEVFSNDTVHFTPADSARYDSDRVRAVDKGRVITTRVRLPEAPWTGKIYATLLIEPVAKDSLEVCDPWDRAGNLRLSMSGQPDLELLRFMTAYGGPTHHRVELSRFAPVLTGNREFKAFVDTWSSPGWRVSVTLEFSDEHNPLPSSWVMPLVYDESVTAVHQPAIVGVKIPEGTWHVELCYLSSGHCTDGRGADEFESKFNVATVDGRQVLRYKPWRTDCTRLRAVNPYTRRWPDGTWSSDYSRSGWCPGDLVAPLHSDLRADLSPGPHKLSFSVEDVRPPDAAGHFGYWRISACLVGWKE